MMIKTLSEMTLEELWLLFPIILSEYSPVWPQWYEEEKPVIEAAAGTENIARISHCGSTSVPGLTAKPTVDILLEIHEGTDTAKLSGALESAGYIFSPQPKKPPPHLMFMKGYTPEGFAERVLHLHVRYPGDWDELYFRDFLREHPETAQEYAALKLALMDRFKNNRDGYTEAKGDFIKNITEKARVFYKGRYTPS